MPKDPRELTRAEKNRRRLKRNRPRFEGETFPCPICLEDERVKLDKRGRAYLTCGWCGVQLWVRSDRGEQILADRIEAGDVGADRLRKAYAAARAKNRTGAAGADRGTERGRPSPPRTAAHTLHQAARR